jgi:uncharacterized protein with ParB-like and HNH nuclease domain
MLMLLDMLAIYIVVDCEKKNVLSLFVWQANNLKEKRNFFSASFHIKSLSKKKRYYVEFMKTDETKQKNKLIITPHANFYMLHIFPQQMS